MPKHQSAETPNLNLRALGLFNELKATTIEELSRRSRRRSLSSGEMLFNAGDASDCLYIVMSGRIRISAVSAAGVEVTLNVLTSGSLFGEIGMLDGSVRTAGASAMDPSELMSIGRSNFFLALESDARLARNVIELLCRRLRWVSARMEDLAIRGAAQRLARLLGFLARDHGRDAGAGIEISIRLTQSELAQWAAMSREGLNKLLVRWADEGLVSQNRRRIVIRDLGRLDEIAEFGE
jgi:CRP-like cAMP-binding protein